MWPLSQENNIIMYILVLPNTDFDRNFQFESQV